ncbi:SWIM zinc finger domain-containing protein [Actinosynnema sp. NPDC091369]
MAIVVAVEVNVGTVRALADEKSFERGEKYFAAGHVRRVGVDGTTVSATVEGTHAYRVRLDVTRTGLRGRCSCPHDVDFCKHCVAAALAWLDQASRVEPTARPRGKPLPEKRLRAFLLGRDPEWLVDQLMAAATTDEVLRARLDVAAGVDADRAFDARGLRERLEFALDVPDYVSLGAADQYFHHVERALDEVDRLVDNGFAAAAADLAEYAVELLEDVDDRVEDLDGLDGAITRARRIRRAAGRR